MTVEDEDIDQNLAALQQTKLEFTRKVNKLKALKHLIQDALDYGEANEEEYNSLQTELEDLGTLMENYEALVNQLRSSSALPDLPSGGQDQIDKSFDDHLRVFLELKVNVTRLMRKLRQKLDGNDKKQFHDLYDSEDSPEEESETSDDHEGQDDEPEQEVEEVKGWTDSCLCKTVSYVTIVVVFYFILGVVIAQVMRHQNDNVEGLCNL